MAQLETLMRRNFVDYASYAILDRAIPDLRDGLKPVQRRILHTLFEMHDGRYHKVANIIGETMKLHPHGDAAIGDALVVLANKGLFIDRQGNFGNVFTGHPAAAARYIEARLTPLALEALFNEALTEMVDSYDSRTREPVSLPSKLPAVLMLGAEGIAVGMATRILPHNPVELWRAQIDLLHGRPVELHPDFPQGGLADVSAYDDGRGKVEVRAQIDTDGDKRVVIREIPFGTTTESVIASIETAVQKGRVKVGKVNDYTTDRVEIELTLPRGVTASEVVPQLYAYTDCSVSLSSNIVVIVDRRPVEVTVGEALAVLTELLVERIRAELEWEQRRFVDRKHWLTLEQIFVEKRVYKRIEEAASEDAVRREVLEGMSAHEALFVRPMVDDDVKRLLELRIRRISAWDIEKHRQEVGEIEVALEDVARKLADLTGTAVAWVEGMIEKYGDDYPRRTRLAGFEQIDVKAVARQTIKLAYDPKSGFFGSEVKGQKFEMTVSEFDLVLGIAADGTYRVMTPPEKQLFSAKLLYCARFDPDAGLEFTLVYRDASRYAYGKRVKIEKFIRNKEYRLFGEGGKVDLLLPDGEEGIAALEFIPAPRQRVKTARFDLTRLEPTGIAARGTRMASKPVKSLKLLVRKPRPEPKRAAAKPPKVTPAARGSKPPKAPVKPSAPAPASQATGRKSAPPKKGGSGPIDGEQGSLF